MRIIGQSVNLRKMYKLGKKEASLCNNDASWLRIKSIVEFGRKYGYLAAIDAFEIGKPTYYNYKNIYDSCIENNVVYVSKSKRPHKIRVADWNKKIVRFICKLRNECPNIGKSKIKHYLDKYCLLHLLKTISTGTIQNIINSYPNKLRTLKSTIKIVHRKNVIRKPSKYKAETSGSCISLDSMEFRNEGKKAYVVVALDEATNLLFARGTFSHTSRSAKQVLEAAHDYLPYEKFTTILTDNGSEFAKEFSKYVNDNGIIHYHTYPKSPKQNARCERVNRTIQDEFMIKHWKLLFTNLTQFNKQLDKYLRWYNFDRVHQRFDNKLTPFQKHLEFINRDKMVA